MAKNSQITKTRGGVAEMTLASPFRSRSEVNTPQGVIVKSFSPILKPAQWPNDPATGKPMVLIGKFVRLFKTKEFERKVGNKKEIVQGWGVEIVPTGAAMGISLPVTATLRTGLDIQGGEEPGEEAKSPFVGRTVEIECVGKVPSKKGNDAWNFLCAIYPEGK